MCPPYCLKALRQIDTGLKPLPINAIADNPNAVSRDSPIHQFPLHRLRVDENAKSRVERLPAGRTAKRRIKMETIRAMQTSPKRPFYCTCHIGGSHAIGIEPAAENGAARLEAFALPAKGKPVEETAQRTPNDGNVEHRNVVHPYAAWQ
jgi:hypothetical protein